MRRRTHYSFILALFVVVASEVDQAAQTEQRFCRLRINVIDYYGRARDYVVETFVRQHGGPNLAQRFDGSVAADIPWGGYDYTLVPRDRKDEWQRRQRVRGHVELMYPQYWLTVSLWDFGGDVGGDGPSGTITPPPVGSGPAWVRLQDAYSDRYEEAEVDSNGGFRFNKFTWGNYVLIVYQGEQILHTQPVYLRLGNPASMKISVRLNRR